MKTINIKNVDLNKAYFHFTLKNNLPSIEKVGLKAKIGDTSELMKDKSCVYLSKGGKGLLGIKNSFIYEFKKLRICDIPVSYRKYFDIIDYSNTSLISKEQVYIAMSKRFSDEVYLLVNAVLGEDYLENEVFGFGADFDIKGIENHDIDASKLSLLTIDFSINALDIIRYVYTQLIEIVPSEIIKDFLGDLDDFFNYLDNERRLDSVSR